MKQLALAIVVVVVGAKDTHAQSAEPPSSPEEVFVAAVEGWREHGLKGVMPHLTRDSQQLVAGSIVYAAGFIVEVMGELTEDGKTWFKLVGVVKKHGVSAELLKDASRATDARLTNKELRRTLLRLGTPVKDWSLLADEAFHILKDIKHLKEPEFTSGMPFFSVVPPGAALTRVYAGDDTAQGNAVSRRGDKETATTIFFRKESGLWKVDLVKQVEERG